MTQEEFEEKFGKVCPKCNKRKGFHMSLGGVVDGNRGAGGCRCEEDEDE